jgi:hypothetical protein
MNNNKPQNNKNKNKTSKSKNKNNKTVKNIKKRNDICVFDVPANYEVCVEDHPGKVGLTLKLGSILSRNDRSGAKEPSTEVPAFFGDSQSIRIYGANHENPTSRYRVVKQPRLFILDGIHLIAMFKRAFGPITKEDELTIMAYISPPLNEKTTYPPGFDEEHDLVIQPTGFVTREDLENYKAHGKGLYVNRKMANLVCRLGFDGWVALPGDLYQWVPSRNTVARYAPEIMLCKWDTFMERIA